MAGGVLVISCGQRSPIGRISPGSDRSVLTRTRSSETGLGSSKVFKVVLGLRRKGFAGRECNRKRSIGCAFGGGGSDTESSNVELPVLTLYELLEISQDVGLSEIKTAYRQMARRYHPDVCPPAARDECTRKFLQVQEAYEILVDPDLRADYDFRLRNPLSVQALTSGFAYDRRSGQRRRGVTHGEVVAKEAWKAHWEEQVGELRRSGRRKPGSWAERMRQRGEGSS
ncbi:hypothetical protein MPTK1_6g08210 [Marchantia polymorpha subsp. ruderalis]|uniref:J domain-containing protein n=2 Tax=Marchantia polymorpha TaxID=3197 RepID=A0AAF6BPT1_MARPO|nr:hypothetical protein MARPO_0060s0100 [Marchantia polymorpha]PTQ37030.1 hypothetical protein MARPO_0060s0100 [Marchantia polymorpha]BBN14015.1 hypothetical protein Mp_6g08210 [Marchantia polymorpha subsp. ruderalis]BBN14016.1 hypothetical protein Mp_6g08210 [Marchantia polymorpha subsp. ruderalis]|eukprot:PTQ37029.1 hypothetical protein MARPO_0060s0100 [Marchantia polymorpha]